MRHLLALVGALLLAGCTADEQPGDPVEPAAFVLTSPAFLDGEPIPSEHTCDGPNTSPHLTANGAPAGTRSLALTMIDIDVPSPDAPVTEFTHWLVWDVPVPGRTVEFLEGHAPKGSTEGANEGGGTGYTGPCPRLGVHRYVFTLYAVDTMLELPEGADRETVEAALEGHVLAETALTGTYERAPV